MNLPRAEQEAAARWDARLRDPACSQADRAAFAAWSSDPANAARFARLQAVLTALREEKAGPVLQPRRPAWPARMALAASLVAGLAIGAWLLVERQPDLLVSAPRSTIRSVRLADGSSILLAPGSVMRFRHAGAGRQATLISGSARLAVAVDDQHPFVLYAADRRVTSSGSEFSVGLSGGQVRIGLLHGQARVHCWHGLLPSEMTLRVGQRLDAQIGSDRARLEVIGRPAPDRLRLSHPET